MKAGSSEKGVGKVVIKGDKVVSYGVSDEDELYIRHYGKKFKSKIKEGRRNGILIDEEAHVRFDYIFLGEKVTPMIYVKGEKSQVVCFPEYGKVYSGWWIYVEGGWGCVNVWTLNKNENENEVLSLYALLGSGEEFLVYESSKFKHLLLLYTLPTLRRVGNIMIVNVKYEKDKEIVKNLRRIAGFDYLYVRQDFNKNVYISFNLKSWKKLEQANRLIFKGGEERIEGYTPGFQEYFGISALEKHAKKIEETLPQRMLNY